MHFDILVPHEEKDINKIYQFGKSYLETKGQAGQPLTSKECNFCHIEESTPEVRNEIEQKGFFIVEMQNCN